MKYSLSIAAVFVSFIGTVAMGYVNQDSESASLAVTGRVVSSLTGEPIAAARVEVRAVDGSRSVAASTTNSEGRFDVPGVTPGRYRLHAGRVGYVDGEYGSRGLNEQGRVVEVSSSQDEVQVIISLTPMGSIAGRVYDAAGNALPGVQVEAYRYEYQAGKRSLSSVRAVESTDDGEFVLSNLAPDVYVISASPLATRSLAGRSITEPLAPTFFPGTRDADDATGIRAEPLRTTTVAIIVSEERRVSVRGQLIGYPSNQPISGTMALVRRSNGGLGYAYQSDNVSVQRGIVANGQFEFSDVIPGPYYIVAYANPNALPGRTANASFVESANRLGGYQAAQVPLDVGVVDIEGLSVPLTPGVSVLGSVSLEGTVNPDALRRMSLRLIPDPGSSIDWLTTDNVSIPSGSSTFEVHGLIPGLPYRLEVRGLPADVYMREARFEGRDVLGSKLMVYSPNSGSQLQIALSNDVGVVDVSVVDDGQRPMEAVRVVLAPDYPSRERMDLIRTGYTDEFGRIRFATVAPGTYRAFAWESVAPDAWTYAPFLLEWETRGTTVSVGAGMSQILGLNVLPAAAGR